MSAATLAATATPSLLSSFSSSFSPLSILSLPPSMGVLDENEIEMAEEVQDSPKPISCSFSSSFSCQEQQLTSMPLQSQLAAPLPSPPPSSATSTSNRVSELEAENARLLAEIEAYKTGKKRHVEEEEKEHANKKQKLSQPILIALKEEDLEFNVEAKRFYASLGNMPSYHALKFVITSIQRIENQQLTHQFATSNAYFTQQKYHQPGKEPIRHVYHGTHPDNIDGIVKDNLSMEKRGQLDSGWFGAGIYFSRHADYCMMYRTTGKFRCVIVGDKAKVLQVDILPGRQWQMMSVKHGAKRTTDYDSHISPNEFEYVLFDSRHILPRYVISFEVVAAKGVIFDGSVEQAGEAMVSKIAPASKVKCIIPGPKVCSSWNNDKLKVQFPRLDTYTWRIPLKKFREEGKLRQDSLDFMLNNLKFCVLLFPFGNPRINGKDRVAAYFEMREGDSSFSITCALTMRVVPPSGINGSTLLVTSHTFSLAAATWGFPELLGSKELVDEFIHADHTIVLEVGAMQFPS